MDTRTWEMIKVREIITLSTSMIKANKQDGSERKED